MLMTWLRAGTQLLFIKAPPMPPNRIPMQIIKTLSGKRKGMGPLRSIQIMKKIVPKKTIFGKFFFYSGMKFITNEVIL